MVDNEGITPNLRWSLHEVHLFLDALHDRVARVAERLHQAASDDPEDGQHDEQAQELAFDFGHVITSFLNNRAYRNPRRSFG